MPSTVVHLGFALLLTAGMMRRAYDRLAVIVVAGAVIFADLDVFTSLVIDGSHRAMFHTLLLPLFVGTYLYVDTTQRDQSLIQARVGDTGVHLAWVTIAVFCLSAVGLDLFTAGGVNLFYPLFDQFYAFNCQMTWSSVEGFTQTFVQVAQGPASSTADSGAGSVSVDVGQKGSTQEYRVRSGVNPSRGPEPDGVERVFPVVYNGWQTFFALSGLIITLIKLRGRAHSTSMCHRSPPRGQGEHPSTEPTDTTDV